MNGAVLFVVATAGLCGGIALGYVLNYPIPQALQTNVYDPITTPYSLRLRGVVLSVDIATKTAVVQTTSPYDSRSPFILQFSYADSADPKSYDQLQKNEHIAFVMTREEGPLRAASHAKLVADQ